MCGYNYFVTLIYEESNCLFLELFKLTSDARNKQLSLIIFLIFLFLEAIVSVVEGVNKLKWLIAAVVLIGFLQAPGWWSRAVLSQEILSRAKPFEAEEGNNQQMIFE
ncbi:hypothetical protein L798_12177 [Zootermopsis nevadensis]|uniref:Uncharacterized protein n=1 Tax=Zootermopsis nevadensis TaxID=136037 RepID=A0A067RIM1_ZOONE|nr:hypothetical protein L798_12177 [Zootermopsis nevadensis]